MARLTISVAALLLFVLGTPLALADHFPGDSAPGGQFYAGNLNCVWHADSVALTPLCFTDEATLVAEEINARIPTLYDAFAGAINGGYDLFRLGYCEAKNTGMLPSWQEIPPCAEIPDRDIVPPR